MWNTLRAGRYDVRVPTGPKYCSPSPQTDSGTHSASYSVDVGACTGVILTTNLSLMPRLRMSGAVPLLPIFAVIAWIAKNFFILHTHV